MDKIIAVVGATASGKTALSIELAKYFNTEIVSCDSMQVYKGMDIGTAKPSIEERGGIAHHMFDVALPGEHYDAGRYSQEAKEVCDKLLANGKIPIVCGGTGLYLKALTQGLAQIPPCPALDHGTNSYEKLKEIDPVTAAKFSPSDTQRINRALNVWSATGKPISYFHSQNPEPSFVPVCVGIAYPDRSVLYDRIEKRVDLMFEAGLIDEVRSLAESGLNKTQAIGYKEVLALLSGEITENEAKEQIKINTRRYAKRQMTWCNNQLDVFWQPFENNFQNISKFVEKNI